MRFLLALGLLAAFPAFGQGARDLPRSPGYSQVLVSPEDAQAALERLRRSGPAAAFYTDFRLRFLPRRGEERSVPGRMWVGLDGNGVPTMLVNLGTASPVHLLLRNGPAPELWMWRADGDGAARMLSGGDLFEPLADTQFTPFTLLMPFVYWQDARFEGVRRVRGRPAYSYVFTPQMPFPAEQAGFSSVRAFLDTQFGALGEVAYLGADARPVLTLRILELRRVSGDWVVRSVDLRDDRTGDKTRLEARAVATRVQMPDWLLDPTGLATPLPEPPADRLTSL